MKIKDIVKKSRSCRRFDEGHKVSSASLEELIELARLSPSASNKQPLKYLIYNTPSGCSMVFSCLKWAGYLDDWDGPEPGERPSAYIIILGDKSISGSFGVDHGIVSQSIMLGAAEKGLGGCIIASVDRNRMRRELGIPEQFEILLVLALGKPVERVIIEEITEGNVKYWRDSDKNHHVPKRPLDELIIKLNEYPE